MLRPDELFLSQSLHFDAAFPILSTLDLKSVEQPGKGRTRAGHWQTNSSQTVTATTTTEGFGQTVATTGSTASAYGFAATSGYRSDGDAGLTLVGARYYDPQVGRFITRDTELDQEAYVYCDGDPVNALDPSGHDFWWVGLHWSQSSPGPNPPPTYDPKDPISVPAGPGAIVIDPKDGGGYQIPPTGPVGIVIPLKLPLKLPSVVIDWQPPTGGGFGGGGSVSPYGDWDVHLVYKSKFR